MARSLLQGGVPPAQNSTIRRRGPGLSPAASTTRAQLHTATLLPNGKVLVAGGTYGGSGDLTSAELYDPTNGTWTATGSLNTKRLRHTATLLDPNVAPGANGKVLVAGGQGGGDILTSAELYDPASGTWTATGSLNIKRQWYTATLLPNGKVLVAGGYGDDILASAELYNPTNGTWTGTGSLNTKRLRHTATLLPNGKVLVAGGIDDLGISHATASAELYDPASGTWTYTGSLNTARETHTATLLPNGNVVAAGGWNVDSFILPSTELYASVAVGQLRNVSTRLKVLTGDNVLIGGFIVTGTTGTKQVLVRGLGPTLTDVGVTGVVLADPTLALYHRNNQGPDSIVATNDNWKQTQQAAIQATGGAPWHDSEAAILQTLAPGNYTAILAGKNSTTGIGLVDVYDQTPASTAQLSNISSRGPVGTGNDVMIGGFISAVTDTTVIVRALGPTLTQLGVTGALADPVLGLFDANGNPIASNDNWRQSSQAAQIQSSIYKPPNDLEPAIISTRPLGNTTAIVSGKNGTTGVALVEVYRLP